MSGKAGPVVCFEASEGLPEGAIDERDWPLPDDERSLDPDAERDASPAADWPELEIPADWGSPRRRARREGA